MFHGTKDFWPVAAWWFRAKFQTSWAMGRDSSNLGLESQPAIRMLIYSQLGSKRDPQGMEHGTRPQFCIIPLQFQWKCCHNPALKLCLLFDKQWDRKSKMSKGVFSERNNEGLQTMIAHVLSTFIKYVGLLFWILEVSVIRNQPVVHFASDPSLRSSWRKDSLLSWPRRNSKSDSNYCQTLWEPHQGNSNSPPPCSAQLATAGKRRDVK